MIWKTNDVKNQKMFHTCHEKHSEFLFCSATTTDKVSGSIQ